jgi:hypothetical protein
MWRLLKAWGYPCAPQLATADRRRFDQERAQACDAGLETSCHPSEYYP